MRTVAAIVGLLIALDGRALVAQPSFDLHIAAGYSATGGGGFQNNGLTAGRIGIGWPLTSEWGSRLDASAFVRLNGGACAAVSSPIQCPSSFPGAARTVTVDATHRTHLGGHFITVRAGLGPAFVGSTTKTPDATALGLEAGVEL